MFLPLFLTAFSVVIASLYAVADPGGGPGEWAIPYFWTKLRPERPLGDRPSPTPLISRSGSGTGMGVLSRFLGCFGPSLLGFELLFTKFWPFSISRKMKGEKIAICWPKSWANPFRKFHFLELYTDQYFYSFRTAVFCLEHYQTLSHGLKNAKNELWKKSIFGKNYGKVCDYIKSIFYVSIKASI